MNTSRRLVSVAGLCLVSAFAAAVGAAPPETLALRELPNRPDHWPESVTLKADAEFGTTTLKQGQSYKLVEYDGSNVVLEVSPMQAVAVTPDDCDLLEAANKMWAGLTPAQRAVDPATIVKDASLWPDKVTCKIEFALTTGEVIPPGTEYDISSVDASGVYLFSAKPGPARVLAPTKQTDLFQRARERAAVEPDKRPSRMITALEPNLVDANGKPVKFDGLDQTKVFVFYFGASWCAPCRAFSPEFVKFVNDNAKANPHMTVVMLNCDDEEAKMLGYMQSEKMPFPAVKKATLVNLGALYGFGCGSIPQMVVTDRYGKVLANTFENSTYTSPKRTLAQLKQILASGAAK